MYNPTQELKNLINRNSFSPDKAIQLVAQGASPNTQDNSGKYLLQLLLKANDDDNVKKLIELYNVDVALAFQIPLTYQVKSLQFDKEPFLLGEGSYGKIYSGTLDTSEVAVKTFKLQTETRVLSFCKRLDKYIKEVQCMMTLTEAKSENIIQLIGIYKNKPGYFDLDTFSYSIVMEKATLGTLEDIIKQQPDLLNSKKTKEHIIDSLVNGLHTIHQYFIYCDFKSGNILISAGDPLNVKIIDFGLACKLDVKHSCGTPMSKAPEILNNKNNTILSDIYSLGLVLRETTILKTEHDNLPIYLTTVDELQEHVMYGNGVYIPDNTCTFKMEMLIQSCLSFTPENRPTTEILTTRLGLKSGEIYKLLKSQLPTMLTTACKYGRTELVKELISNKNINEVSKEGSTPLIAACMSSHTHNKPELFQLLVEYNVNYNTVNTDGRTALDLAFLNKNKSAIHTLMHDVHNSLISRETIMSSETILLAKEWVLQNGLQHLFNDGFFKPIEDSNIQKQQDDEQWVENALGEFSLSQAIKKIGFFPSPKKILNDKEVNFLVKCIFEGKTQLEKIPEAYGLRSKTLCLFKRKIADKIANAHFLMTLNEAITQLNTVLPHLEPNPINTITNIQNFLDGIVEAEIIPEQFGIRAKAMELKTDYTRMKSFYNC